MDNIEARLHEVTWEYADQDLFAIDQLTARIAQTGRKFGLISYTDLTAGVPFSYASIDGGSPHYLGASGEWTGLDRRILGDCLGYISAQTYFEGKFMASALVISRAESKPSEMFFAWMKELGVIPNLSEQTVLKFWTDQVHRAHRWYRTH